MVNYTSPLAMASKLVSRQHIQDHASADHVKHHWGYADRVVPCVNDAGSCEYLDAVYWMHDVSMLYTFIMWAVIGGILAIIVTCRLFKPSVKNSVSTRGDESQKVKGQSAYYRASRGIQAFFRKWLLPESLTRFFGNVTRLQLLTLAIVLGYLLIFSLVGIVYRTWITPVKNMPGVHNTRTGIGGFADRVGALAYALTPLTIALATRESILTLLTGIPYQSFNFMHRWLGRIIFVQSWLHTIGWVLIEGRLYQPQPKVWNNFIKQLYMIWGVIALIFINFLFFFSLTRVIKWTGHEFFRKAHYIVGMLYIGACWGHWNQLACWMIASLGVWGVDRGMRFLRTLLIHTGNLKGKGFGFHSAQSTLEYFDDEDGGVVRLEFTHNHDSWSVGQHFFLCFPQLSVWQSHPFTTMSVPANHPALPKHTYIARCRKGETQRLKTLALTSSTERETKSLTTTPVVLCGPYGTNLLPSTAESTNILAVAGGTGVSTTLPLCLSASALPSYTGASSPAIDFIWMIRRASNTQWISSELEDLKRRAARNGSNLQIHIYVTQETSSSSSATPSIHETSDVDNAAPAKTSLDINVTPVSKPSSSSSTTSISKEKALASSTNFTITYMDSAHPSLGDVVSSFLETRADSAYRTKVVASGPRGMGSDLRAAVARENDGGKVWKGERRWDVELEFDDRG